jgi:hypothetical protein
MKLLFIYGPPAAGKLTVAQHIVDRTDFRLFHNHLTIELAKEVFEDRKIRSEVVLKLRLDIIAAAAKANIDLIFTMVYAKLEDDNYVKKIVAAVEDNGGEVCFVQLIPDLVEVGKRVAHASRRSFSKIKDPLVLREVMANNDLYGAVPYSNNLTINNTVLAPSDVAGQIIDHFGLESIDS